MKHVRSIDGDISIELNMGTFLKSFDTAKLDVVNNHPYYIEQTISGREIYDEKVY